MSELETRMAIGQKIHAVGKTEGNRTVTYNQDGKKWTVTFVKNRATAVSTTVEMAEAKGK
jgi:outer membrane biogenesis lipoprotein LolB